MSNYLTGAQAGHLSIFDSELTADKNVHDFIVSAKWGVRNHRSHHH
jgi:hypothetical protein